MKRIVRLLWLPGLLWLSAACSPQTLTMLVDMRYPSRSGLDLGRKTMAVVYVDHPADSAFNRTLATSFARRMEEEYFDGEEAIGLYKVPEGGVYSAKDSLRRLVMETDRDVVFLFDPADTTNIRLYVYDSMYQADTVLSYAGRTTAEAETVGRQSTAKFVPQWRAEEYAILYYETSGWEEALEKAYGYQWQEAVARWLILYGKAGNPEMQACAAYDIALGCYMLGDNALALRWIERADMHEPLAPVQSLRERVLARMGRAS